MSLPSARHLIQQMHNKELSFTAVTEQHLLRIKQLNPKVNALVTLNEDAALDEARYWDQQITQAKLPALAGLPITIKDAFATAGLRTTSSHPPLADYHPVQDATLVKRLRQAGATILGKTNLPPLAGAPHCNSPMFGPTRNPWDLQRTSGGSSGGSAAAVALGFSCLDIGSDIGGSIRIPAAFCGIAGLKATENRLPRTGHIPHLPNEKRSVRHCLSFGLLARDIDSLQLGFAHLPGSDRLDAEVPPLPYLTPHLPNRPLRIAWWSDFAGLPLCQRTATALQRSVEALSKQGVEVKKAKPEGFDINKAWEAYGVIAGCEIGLGMPSFQRHLLATLGKVLPRSQNLARSFAKGLRFNLHHYNDALHQRDQLIIALEQFLEQWDAWLCPVAPTVAYSITQQPWSTVAFDEHRLPYLEASVSMTTPFSITGSPVLVLPAGIENGLPVGLQLIGRRWQDEQLLEVGKYLEPLLGGYQQPPLLNQQEGLHHV